MIKDKKKLIVNNAKKLYSFKIKIITVAICAIIKFVMNAQIKRRNKS